MVQVQIADVIIDEDLYPRQKVNDQHARGMATSMQAGFVLPPILLDQATMVLVDGRHRLTAHRLLDRTAIEATLKQYASRADLFEEAILANAVQGLSLSAYDKVKATNLAIDLGLSEDRLAHALRTSIEHLRAIKTRYATLEDAESALPGLRKVHLKASLRHFTDRVVTSAQAQAIEHAPGQSYLLLVRQLLDAINFELLPPVESSPRLYGELRTLRDLLDGLDLPEEVDQPS